MRQHLTAATLCVLLAASAFAQADPLPSWHEGKTKKTITDFVARVTKSGSPDFVPVAERIATFDNDGTLWSEQPLYFQLLFAMDRVKAIAAEHPDWKDKEPYRSLLAGDMKSVLAGGEKSLIQIAVGGHSGLTTEEFEKVVREWFATARHPKTNRPYSEMVFQPMVELLDYLRANGFKTYIVSGGGIDFMRAFAESAYGIPPEQVIGSTGKLKYEIRDGKPVLFKEPAIEFVDDGEGKPFAIHRIIGRRPVIAFGNSDGDLPMLQWTAAGTGPRLAAYIHHTDGLREWAYDRISSIGRLDKGLDEANAKGWTVVDMKNDWKVIFPPQTIAGKRWKLSEVNGIPVKSMAYLEFDLQAKRFSGNGGCNLIGGDFTLTDMQLRFSKVISTKRACLEGDNEKIESDFLKALDETTGFQLQNGVLRLTSGDRTHLMFN